MELTDLCLKFILPPGRGIPDNHKVWLYIKNFCLKNNFCLQKVTETSFFLKNNLLTIALLFLTL